MKYKGVAIVNTWKNLYKYSKNKIHNICLPLHVHCIDLRLDELMTEHDYCMFGFKQSWWRNWQERGTDLMQWHSGVKAADVAAGRPLKNLLDHYEHHNPRQHMTLPGITASSQVWKWEILNSDTQTQSLIFFDEPEISQGVDVHGHASVCKAFLPVKFVPKYWSVLLYMWCHITVYLPLHSKLSV